jgi:hypothetical protein
MSGTFWRVSMSAVGPHLVRVGRADDVQVRHRAQGRDLLDGLVRRAVLA